MKTFILFWTPDYNWYELSTLSYCIQYGMCGEDAYPKRWEIENNKDIKDGDRFFIISTLNKMPKDDQIYDYLKFMGAQFTNFDGVCFGGHFSSDPYEDEDNKIVVDLNLDFAVQPGMLKIFSINKLKKIIPGFDWKKKSGEYLIDNINESKFIIAISEWMVKSNMEASSYTNFTERDFGLAFNNLFGGEN